MAQPTDYVRRFTDAVRGKLGEVADRREGSRWDALAGGIEQALLRADLGVIAQIDAQLLDRATEGDLDRHVRARGPVVRFPAAKARGVVTFTRSVATAGGGVIAAGTEIRAPFQGRSYVFVTKSDAPVSVSALTASAEVEAQAEGEASNVGTVTAGLALTGTPTPLFDTTLKPTNLRAAGGAKAETDAELRERHRLWSRGRQRATAAAVAFGAMRVNGVKHVVTADIFDQHFGSVTAIYVGDVNWNSSEPLLREVATEIERWRALGVPLFIGDIESVAVTVTATVELARSASYYDIPTLRARATRQVLDYFDKRVDPYAYDVDMLKGRIARAHDEVYRVKLSSPTVSVASPLGEAQVLVNGGLPETLTRYSTSTSLITLDFTGPT